MDNDREIIDIDDSAIEFPPVSSDGALEIYFDRVQKAVIERSKVRGQDPAKLSLVVLALDEIKRNKIYLDASRVEVEGTSGTKRFVDMSAQSDKLIKNIKTVYEFLIDQDKSTIDFDGLKKVLDFFLDVLKDILVTSYNFGEPDINKLHNILKQRSEEIDSFVFKVVRSQSSVNRNQK